MSTPSHSSTPLSKPDRFKLLKAVEAQLNKQFSTTASLVRMGSKVGQVMPSISGDLPTFDFGVIGTGGIPRGRIVELYGPESGGKTTLALHYCACEQKLGGIAAVVDAEHALDPNYASALGVDMDELIVAQPDSGEQALETVEALLDSRAVSLIIVDSVAALVPQAELDGEMGDSHMGLQARLMSQAMRKLRGKCSESGIPIVFINQIREKIGVMFGSPETTPGGRALKFYASVRIDVRRNGAPDAQIKSGDTILGHRIKLKCVKNKVGVPFRATEVALVYGVGLDTFADFVEYAVSIGAIQQGGSWYSINGTRIANGLTAAVAQVRDSPALLKEIKAEVAKAQAAQREADRKEREEAA